MRDLYLSSERVSFTMARKCPFCRKEMELKGTDCPYCHRVIIERIYESSPMEHKDLGNVNSMGKRSLLRESRFAKKLGGAFFGFLLGGLITNSIWSGATFIFTNETEGWSLTFWGEHYLTRILGGIIGVAVGSFVAGCIAKKNGARWGVISALPRISVWVFVAIFGIHGVIQGYIISISIWQWVTISILIGLIPLVAYYAGKIGQETRVGNREFFENRRGTLLGIRWYHWLWLFFPIHVTGLLAIYSIYQMIMYLLLVFRSLLWFFIIGSWVEVLIGGGLYLLGRGMYETYSLLALGHQRGLTNRKIAKHIALWLIGSYVGVNLLQLFAGWMLARF